MQDYDGSLTNISKTNTQIVQSMQERNRQMRSDAKLNNKNLMLQEKVMEQQEEIKQLRQHLRDMFEDQEDKIVTASYSNTAMAQTDVASPELH